MDEERFWTLIEAAWAPLETAAARHALPPATPTGPATTCWLFTVVDKALNEFIDNLPGLARDLTSEELTDLDRVAERKLHDIDRSDIHAVTDGSDDGFLYARGFIVAMGREFYTAVATNPRIAILDAECESMCYLFAHLHRERFGAFPDTGSGISRESCTNPTGWQT